MFVSVKNNKWQIMVSVILGIFIQRKTDNSLYTVLAVLFVSHILRYLNFDKQIDRIIN